MNDRADLFDDALAELLHPPQAVRSGETLRTYRQRLAALAAEQRSTLEGPSRHQPSPAEIRSQNLGAS
jgi:hypothetical protein